MSSPSNKKEKSAFKAEWVVVALLLASLGLHETLGDWTAQVLGVPLEPTAPQGLGQVRLSVEEPGSKPQSPAPAFDEPKASSSTKENAAAPGQESASDPQASQELSSLKSPASPTPENKATQATQEVRAAAQAVSPLGTATAPAASGQPVASAAPASAQSATAPTNPQPSATLSPSSAPAADMGTPQPSPQPSPQSTPSTQPMPQAYLPAAGLGMTPGFGLNPARAASGTFNLPLPPGAVRLPAMASPSAFTGTWSGEFSGAVPGTLRLFVAPFKVLSGEGHLRTGERFMVAGVVQDDGQVNAVAEAPGQPQKVTITGRLVTNGQGQGAWQALNGSLLGTWAVRKD